VRILTPFVAPLLIVSEILISLQTAFFALGGRGQSERAD